MTTLNYGLIGCGMMGQEHLRNIALLANARVAAIFEPDAGMRAIAAGMVRTRSWSTRLPRFLAVEASTAC